MTILLTGVTGLVGCHAAIALVKAGHDVVTLARGAGNLSTTQRVRQTLQAYPGWNGAATHLSRASAVGGNMRSVLCGLDASDRDRWRGQIEAVVNCAGSVTFGDRDSDLNVNTDGVLQLLNLSHDLECHRVLHISTAYVPHGNSPCRTPYEESKLRGEQILQEFSAKHEIEAVTLRPSIVTGDRRYGFTPTFNGLYPFLRFAAIYWGRIGHLAPEDWFPRSLLRTGTINLLPADMLGSSIVEILDNWDAASPILTLINPTDWRLDDFAETVYACLTAAKGCAPPENGRSKEPPKRVLQSLLDLYAPYMEVSPGVHPDSGVILPGGGQNALSNDQSWIASLIDWGIETDWQEPI